MLQLKMNSLLGQRISGFQNARSGYVFPLSLNVFQFFHEIIFNPKMKIILSDTNERRECE